MSKDVGGPGVDRAKTLSDAVDERRAASPRQLPSLPCLSLAAQEASTVRETNPGYQLAALLLCAMIADRYSFTTMAPRPSITGFDPKKFAAASANGTKGDPWAR